MTRNADALQGGNATGTHFVGHAAHAQNKVCPYALADGVHHFHGKAHPVFQRTAKGRVQRIGGR